MKLPLFGKNLRGFTLVELLIVIAIISILISIGLASFSRVQMQSRDRQRQAALSNMAGALEQYYSNNNHYPTDLNDLTSEPTTAQPYLKALPTDPSDSTVDAWDTYDLYGGTSGNQAYCLAVSELEIRPSPQTDCNSVDYDFVVSSQD